MNRLDGLVENINEARPGLPLQKTGTALIDNYMQNRLSGLVDEKPVTPQEQEQQINEVLDVSEEYGIPVADTYKFVAGPEPSLFGSMLNKVKEKIRERTGYFEPPIYGKTFREEQPLRTAGKMAAFYGAEYLSGRTGTVLDILAAKTKGDKSLADSIARLSEFEPTPEEAQRGIMLKYLGLFSPVRAGVKGLTGLISNKALPSQSLRTILNSGLTFSSTNAALQFSQNVTEGKPIDWSDIHLSGGIGVLFGSAEALIGKGVEKWTAEKLTKAYYKNMPGLKEIPKKELRKVAQAAIDSHKVRAGVMDADVWQQTHSNNLYEFSEKLKNLGKKPDIFLLPKGKIAPELTAGIAKTVAKETGTVTPEGSAWLTEITNKVNRGIPITEPEKAFLQKVQAAEEPVETKPPAPEGKGEGEVVKQPWEMKSTSKEYADMSIEEVDRAAFGFSREDITTLKPEQLAVKWKVDNKNVLAKIKDYEGTEKEWAETIDLSESIDVIYEDGKFKIDDGYNRYNAAKILGKELNVSLEIKDKPHIAIIKNAVEQGKPVPREVLEEYKGLKWVDEALVKLTPTPPEAQAKPAGKEYYTSVPDEWRAENDLYDWGKKGLRAKGNKSIGGKKSFKWAGEFDEVPVRLPKATMDALKAKTDEIFKVHNRKGDDYYIVPPKVLEQVKAELGENAFKQLPKPERSPKQKINDAINSMKRQDKLEDAEIGAWIEGYAQELGLTKADYTDNIRKYIEALNNDPEADAIRKDFRAGVEQAVQPAAEEAEERLAIQNEQELTEEIGDFLEGIVEKGKPPKQTDLEGKTTQLSADELKGGLSQKQGEMFDKEDFKTIKEQDRINAEKDIRGQTNFLGKEAGFVEVGKTIEAMKAPARWFLSVFEPAKLTAKAHKKEVVATIMRSIHKPELATLKFGQEKLEQLDLDYNQAEQWLNKYPKEVQEAIMLTRGRGLEGKARALQKKAFASLPKELKDSKVRRALDEIADFNYEYLSQVFGEEIETLFGTDIVNVPGYVQDYFYGVYKNPKKINNFLSFWKTTDKYTKHKVFPTYADAKAYGLEIKNPNPVTNLKAEYRAISYKASMQWLKDELMRLGEGKYVMPKDEAPATWLSVGGREYADPTFSDVLVEPELAKLINNLISTNKVSQIRALKTLRDVNNFLRSLKFIGSAFHMVQIAKQSVADSGYLGFYKPTARRGFTKGFEKNDPIFKTPEYKWYIENGGGHQYAVENEARLAFDRFISQLTESEQYIIKTATAPLRIPVKFIDWMFDSYIPKVKYAKYLDWGAEKEKKLGRPLTAGETQEIIKEGQNLYGMMNERLFGRSGTVTSALRFWFIAPAYAEGNSRTMIKAAYQWGQGEDGHSASRSRSNILNSWIVTSTAATVGTLILTGKPPKKPETIEEYRDLLKIDTGKKDEHGNRIMIDLATYDRDYWDIYFNTLRGRPDIAIDNAITRIGGMKAPTAKMINDLFDMMQGKAIYDWKEDKVFHITDPTLQKISKLIAHEVKELVPISVSVFKSSRQRGIDRATAALETLLGFRPGRTERDKKEFEIVRDIWDMRDKREALSYRLNSYDDPWRAIELYNRTLENIEDNKFITDELKGQIDKLKIDPEKVVTWKRFPPERMTVPQIITSLEENVHKRGYRGKDGVIKRQGDPHKGKEQQVKNLKAEYKSRTGKDYKYGAKK